VNANALVLSRGHNLARRVQVVVFNKACADLSSLSLQKGEGHAAANEQRVHAV